MQLAAMEDPQQPMRSLLTGYVLALCRAIASCTQLLDVLGLLQQAESTLLRAPEAHEQQREAAEAAGEELAACRHALLAATAAAAAAEPGLRPPATQQQAQREQLRQLFYASTAFGNLLETLLTVVAPDWLPRFTKQQRQQLFDAWFDAAPAAALLPALLRHLSAVQPSNLPGRPGRVVVTAVSADEAAGILAARFAAPGSSGVRELLQLVMAAAAAAAGGAALPADEAAAASRGPTAGGERAAAAQVSAAAAEAAAAGWQQQEEGLAAALASVPERAAAVELQQLRPGAYVPAVAAQLLDLLAEQEQQQQQQRQQQQQQQQPAARQQSEQPGQPQGVAALAAAGAAGTAFAADVLGRFCRRGHQQQVAAALLRRVQVERQQQQHEQQLQDLPVGAVASSIVAAMPDSAALDKLLEAALKEAASEAMSGSAAAAAGDAGLPLDAPPAADPAAQAAAAALCHLLPPAVWLARADARLLLTDKLLVQQQRRLLPLSALRGLLLFLRRQQQQQGDSSSSDGGSSMLPDAAARVAQLWGDASAVQRLSAQQQAYLTAALCCSLLLLGRQQLDGHPQLLPLLLSGITTRLDSPLLYVRRQAMRVGQQLSLLLDPSKPPMFAEDQQQLQELLPEERWEQQQQQRLPVAAAGARAPGTSGMPGANSSSAAAGSGGGKAAAHASSARQQRREQRQLRRQQREQRQRRRRGDEEREAEGPLTETDSDDNGGEASSVSSSGTDGSTSSGTSGEFEQYDLEESDDEDPARSKLQLRDLPKMLLSKAEEDWKGQLRALRQAEYLIRAAPDELEQYAVPLARALVHTKVPPWMDEEMPAGGPPANMQRFRDVVSLLVGAPESTGLALAAEMYGPSMDVYQRGIILDGMAAAAAEISTPGSSLPPLPGLHKQQQRLGGPAATAAAARAGAAATAAMAAAAGLTAEQQQLLATTADGRKRVGTVTRIASRSLAAAARRQGGRGPRMHVNRFPPIALKWAAALLRHCDEPQHGIDLLGKDHFLLGKLLVTLGSFLEASAQSSEAATLAAATLELMRCGRVHNHPEPFVRRAALLAAGQVLGAVPPARLATAMLSAAAGGSSVGMAMSAAAGGRDAADEALVSRLEWLREWAESVAAQDTDDSCRMMADSVRKLQGSLAAGALAALGSSQQGGTPLDGGSLLTSQPAGGSGGRGQARGGVSLLGAVRLPDIRLP